MVHLLRVSFFAVGFAAFIESGRFAQGSGASSQQFYQSIMDRCIV